MTTDFDMIKQAEPATPAMGQIRYYTGTDGNLHRKMEGGSDTFMPSTTQSAFTLAPNSNVTITSPIGAGTFCLCASWTTGNGIVYVSGLWAKGNNVGSGVAYDGEWDANFNHISATVNSAGDVVLTNNHTSRAFAGVAYFISAL